jgi:predicted nucleic-acid-binding protein
MKRIAVDTNILVRLFARDDGEQWEIVQRLLSESSWMILPTVLMETEWVLRSKFRLSQNHISHLFHDLITANDVEIAQRDAVVAAVGAYASGMDFADALHLALLENGSTFVTFDIDLTKRAKQNFSNLVVELAN